MGIRERLSGNEAAAIAMKQINPDVVAAFPITPSTEIPQYFSTFVSNGEEEAVRMQATEILNELQEKVNGRRLSPEKIGKVLSSKGFINVKSNGISKWIVKKNQVS